MKISLIPIEYGVILNIKERSIDIADITPNNKLLIMSSS